MSLIGQSVSDTVRSGVAPFGYARALAFFVQNERENIMKTNVEATEEKFDVNEKARELEAL